MRSDRINLGDMINKVAFSYKNKVAIVDVDRRQRVTYGEY